MIKESDQKITSLLNLWQEDIIKHCQSDTYDASVNKVTKSLRNFIPNDRML